MDTNNKFTFSITFELNFCTDNSRIGSINLRIKLSEYTGSPNSNTYCTT